MSIKRNVSLDVFHSSLDVKKCIPVMNADHDLPANLISHNIKTVAVNLLLISNVSLEEFQVMVLESKLFREMRIYLHHTRNEGRKDRTRVILSPAKTKRVDDKCTDLIGTGKCDVRNKVAVFDEIIRRKGISLEHYTTIKEYKNIL